MKNISKKLIKISAVIVIVLVVAFSSNAYETYADYVINGVTLPLKESGYGYGDIYGASKCWYFVQHIYYRIWGRFFSPYAGTDDDILRNYPKGEMRRISASNAKLFISAAPLGSCIRLMTSPYGSDSVASTSRHSLILLAKNESGCVLYHAWAAVSCVDYFSWESFESRFRYEYDYGYFKYIKCPGAKPLEYKPAVRQTENELTVTARLADTVEFTEVKR